jgi:hypothetical protein
VSGGVETLFDEFAAAYARGEHPEVLAFLERAGAERDALGRLIDVYLRTAPVQPSSEETLRQMRARRAEPALLRLRTRLGLKRSVVIGRLVDLLGLPAAVESRLQTRYHELETDLLKPERVDPSVWQALREIFGQDVRELVGTAVERPAPAVASAFFREAESSGAPPSPTPGRTDAEARVDGLFGAGE